jgi:hypothetical protein
VPLHPVPLPSFRDTCGLFDTRAQYHHASPANSRIPRSPSCPSRTISPLTWRRFSDPVCFRSALCKIEGKYWTDLQKQGVYVLQYLPKAWWSFPRSSTGTACATMLRSPGPSICCACLSCLVHIKVPRRDED